MNITKHEALKAVIYLMEKYEITPQDFIDENLRMRKEANRQTEKEKEGGNDSMEGG